MTDAEAVLRRREERRATHEALLARFALPVVSITVVAPGPLKDSPAIRRRLQAADAAARACVAGAGWTVVESCDLGGPTGPESIFVVDAEPRALKRALVALEDAHPGGRLWDVDVVCAGPYGPQPLGRGELGEAPRRCVLCERPAHACARARRHPLPVLLAGIEAVDAGAAVPGDAPAWAALAAEALRVEARLTPKPGLVDAAGSGSHDDMTLDTLLASADALEEWFLGCVLLGRAQGARAEASEGGGPGVDEAALDGLVAMGKAAEDAMLTATGGVNTHRGALFSLGLILGAVGQATAGGRRPDVDAVCADAGRVAGVLRDRWARSLGARAARDQAGSHGERAYLAAGTGGIRAEAASGFATVRGAGLPALRERRAASGGAGREDAALLWALVSLMAVVDDSNMVTRGGVAGLREAQAWASGLVSRRPDDDALVAELRAADDRFVARRWSPGGSADLLALTWFLDRVGAIGRD